MTLARQNEAGSSFYPLRGAVFSILGEQDYPITVPAVRRVEEVACIKCRASVNVRGDTPLDGFARVQAYD